ncbi:phosphate signaling complex PhoU family protein [Kutzneria sp. CA-103260]|uniref:phosphate signaling complex PhoU family protein n=1 Tax=Kutzneria sp. CA-103260 TaxID=2802641 RepID=UPI001BEFF78C|nr:PhoU domain-containing protein [Kutzneria sp. CA-103260]QUQ71470.1 phosphate transport system protein [Kutzneria sp. CA-103260]
MGKVKHRRLDQLADLCRQVGEAMQRASVALLDADLTLAEKVITGDAALARSRSACEEQLLVATDLRVVLAAVHAVDTLERMGELALHIARAARRRHPAHVLPDELRLPFADMGQLAITLANTAEQVIRTGDPELVGFLDASDDVMDDLHRAVFAAVTREDWPHGVAVAVDATVLSQNYERFADHAVSLARRTSVFARGELAA